MRSVLICSWSPAFANRALARYAGCITRVATTLGQAVSAIREQRFDVVVVAVKPTQLLTLIAHASAGLPHQVVLASKEHHARRTGSARARTGSEYAPLDKQVGELVGFGVDVVRCPVDDGRWLATAG